MEQLPPELLYRILQLANQLAPVSLQPTLALSQTSRRLHSFYKANERALLFDLLGSSPAYNGSSAAFENDLVLSVLVSALPVLEGALYPTLSSFTQVSKDLKAQFESTLDELSADNFAILKPNKISLENLRKAYRNFVMMEDIRFEFARILMVEPYMGAPKYDFERLLQFFDDGIAHTALLLETLRHNWVMVPDHHFRRVGLGYEPKSEGSDLLHRFDKMLLAWDEGYMEYISEYETIYNELCCCAGVLFGCVYKSREYGMYLERVERAKPGHPLNRTAPLGRRFLGNRRLAPGHHMFLRSLDHISICWGGLKGANGLVCKGEEGVESAFRMIPGWVVEDGACINGRW